MPTLTLPLKFGGPAHGAGCAAPVPHYRVRELSWELEEWAAVTARLAPLNTMFMSPLEGTSLTSSFPSSSPHPHLIRIFSPHPHLIPQCGLPLEGSFVRSDEYWATWIRSPAEALDPDGLPTPPPPFLAFITHAPSHASHCLSRHISGQTHLSLVSPSRLSLQTGLPTPGVLRGWEVVAEAEEGLVVVAYGIFKRAGSFSSGAEVQGASGADIDASGGQFTSTCFGQSRELERDGTWFTLFSSNPCVACELFLDCCCFGQSRLSREGAPENSKRDLSQEHLLSQQ